MKNESLIEFLEYVPFARIFFRRRKDVAARPKNKLVSILVELASLFLLYWLLSPTFAMPVYNALIFHPINEKDDLSDQIKMVESKFQCTFQEVQFKAPDGETLNGWYFLHPGSRKTIMISHGNAGNIVHRLTLCPLLLQTGSSLFLYDYEGFGKSTGGSPSVAKCCADSVAAFDFLTEKLHVKTSNIVLYGESIGTGITSELSTRRTAAAIVLQSPFTSLPELGADHVVFLKLYPASLYPSPHLNIIDIMSRPHAPLLIIHGMKDDTLSYRYSEQIMKRAMDQKTLVLLPDAGHNDIYKTDVSLSLPALNKFIAALPD
jgi:alpha-beta hydrolase superfamily lysophospholipase